MTLQEHITDKAITGSIRVAYRDEIILYIIRPDFHPPTTKNIMISQLVQLTIGVLHSIGAARPI